MMMILSMLRSTVLSKAGSVLIGLVVLCTLIWFAGPYVGIKEASHRLMIIGAVLGIYILYVLINWIITRKRAAKFDKELSEQGADEGHKADIAALRGKMQDAISSLKTSDLGIKHRGKAALYALPWYMVIGPSAAGKSTLLRNSGLHFPYQHADDVDIKGVGGTRNCDWWFSDEAVILDTAGRYTTEDNDKTEWLEFLALLKKHRRKMPINGIIVAISISDLLTTDDAGMDWHVKVVRDRINELITHLGFVFPLYIVFTKCDLLNGFQSFFGDLNETSRGQVWGSYLNIKAGENPGDYVDRKFGELYIRLCEWRIRKLHMQRKQQIKSQIFDFPAQFQAAAMRLLEFINLLFKDNPYQETPNFKGVYFTSGTQEGLPLQRIVGNLRQAFGYADKKDGIVTTKNTKSYFIKNLLKDVIFKSAIDVNMSRRKQIFTRWFKTATIIGCFGFITAAVAAYSTSFTNNTLLLAEGTSVVEDLHQVQQNRNSTTANQFLALNKVYDQYKALIVLEEDRPWYFNMGIYHGDHQIKPLEQVIIKSMERDFLVPVARLLERKLVDYSRRWKTLRKESELAELHTNYYDTLKVYLMLSSPKRLIDQEATPLLLASWKSILTPDGRIPNKKLKNVMEANSEILIKKYLAHMRLPSKDKLAASHWRINKSTVRTARSQLQTPPNAEVLYTQIVKKSEGYLKPLEIRYALKTRGSNYFSNTKKIPGIYTQKGWEDYASREFKVAVHMASYGDWVLGSEIVPDVGDTAASEVNKNKSGKVNITLAKELEQQIRQRYFADYTRQWYDFLGNVKIQGDRSINDTANKLDLLARVDGPIAELFLLLDKNINLQEVEWRQSGDNNREYSKFPIKGSKVKELERPFEDLRRFTTPGEKLAISELLNKYLTALAGLQGEFENLRTNNESAREAELVAATVLSGQGNNTAVYQAKTVTVGLINGSRSRTRRVIEPIFMAPIKGSWRVIMGSAMGEIQSKWSSIVVAEYEDRIRGRFPFTDNGPDAAIEDVAEFFHPEDGVLWTFVRDHLGSYLYKHNGKWRQRSWMGLSAGFNKNFVYALNRSQRISSGLFKRGGMTPEMTFYLYPVPTKGISEITLESNGQLYRYRNGPQEWRRFQWPGDSDSTGASITAISELNNMRAEQTEHGMWGIFHLFRKARLVKERGTQYLSVWNMEAINGKPIRVSFKVKADRSNNLLQPGLFNKYSIPKRIIGGGRKRPSVASRG